MKNWTETATERLLHAINILNMYASIPDEVTLKVNNETLMALHASAFNCKKYDFHTLGNLDKLIIGFEGKKYALVSGNAPVSCVDGVDIKTKENIFSINLSNPFVIKSY